MDFAKWVQQRYREEREATNLYSYLSSPRTGVVDPVWLKDFREEMNKEENADLRKQFAEHAADESRHSELLRAIRVDLPQTEPDAPKIDEMIVLNIRGMILSLLFDEAMAIVTYMEGLEKYWDLAKPHKLSILGIVADEMDHFVDLAESLRKKDQTFQLNKIEQSADYPPTLAAKCVRWNKNSHWKKVCAISLSLIFANWIREKWDDPNSTKTTPFPAKQSENITKIGNGSILNKHTCWGVILNRDQAGLTLPRGGLFFSVDGVPNNITHTIHGNAEDTMKLYAKTIVVDKDSKTTLAFMFDSVEIDGNVKDHLYDWTVTGAHSGKQTFYAVRTDVGAVTFARECTLPMTLHDVAKDTGYTAALLAPKGGVFLVVF